MMANILFICTGNLNRSAAAHVILEFHNSNHKVQSCGTGKVAPLHRKIPRKMRLALEELAYNPNDHRSQGLTPELLEWADQIVCMGNVHVKRIAEQYPQYNNKVINWLIDDPHFATGVEKHRAVTKEIEIKVLNHFGGSNAQHRSHDTPPGQDLCALLLT